MTVLKETTIQRFVGLAGDTKPTSVAVGSTFLEYDTQAIYVTYDGTTWVKKDGLVAGTLKQVSVTKILKAATAYAIGDVLSESATGTLWDFSAIARANGADGYITKAVAISESATVTPSLTLFLFNASTVTCELDDNASSNAVVHADEALYVGAIDFPAMDSIGQTADSIALATPNTYGNLPLAFQCASGADDLFGLLVTRTAFTQVASSDMILKLITEQY